MQSLAAGMQTSSAVLKPARTAGFTLIEILVVLVILGITASIAAVSFGDFGHAKSIQAEAARVAKTIRLIRYYAVLEETPYRIVFSSTGYQIRRAVAHGRWTNINNRHLKPHRFAEKTTVRLETSLHKTGPIIIQSSGEVTPFKLSFYKKNSKEVVAVLLVSMNGAIDVRY